MSMSENFIIPPSLLGKDADEKGELEISTAPPVQEYSIPPTLLQKQPSAKVTDLVGTASPFAQDGSRARGVVEQAAVNGVDYSAADRDLDYMRLAVSHERTIPQVAAQADAIDKYLPRTQKLMVSHGPALVAAGWNDMQNVSGFERVGKESALASDMGRLGMEQQRLNLRRFWGLDDASDRATLLDVESKIAKYGEYRKDEVFFSGALRGMFQTFVPQAMAGGEKVITRGLQAGAAAGIASAAFGPAAIPASGTAFGIGASAGAVEYAYEQSLAEIYGSLAGMKDATGNKLNSGTARALSVVGGAAMAGLELTGLKYALDLMPGMKNLVTGKAVQSAIAAAESTPAIAKAVGESGIRLLKALGAEVATESAQEAVVIGAETAATSLARGEGRKAAHISPEDAMERIVESGEEAAKAFFFPSLAGASLGGLGAYRTASRKAQHAQMERENIASLAKAVQQSAFITEAPTAAENVLRFATDGKPLYFSPQALTGLFQTENGQAIAKSMGITAGQVADAIDLGVDVPVPISKQSALMRSEFWQDVEPYAKLTPAGATQEQSLALAEGEASVTADALGDFMTMLDEVDQQATRRDNWKQWTEGYRFELEEAGYTKLQADSFGDVLAAHAEIFAPMFNQYPKEYLEQRLARIERVTPTSFEKNKQRFLSGIAWNTQQEALAAEQEKVHITEKSPLMASIWGQANAESVKKSAGPDVYKELVKRYGRGVFAKKGKGVAWDVAVQAAIDRGLVPNTANASDVADALAGNDVLYQNDTSTAGANTGAEFEEASRLWKDKGTKSPYFKKWFGNSKVTDKEGNPLVVYHSGTFNEKTDIPNIYETVEPVEELGMHFGTIDAAKFRESYATSKKHFNTTQAYIKIENIKRVDDSDGDWNSVIVKAKDEGYDGLVYTNEVEDAGSDSYVIFSPDQVKSVNNRGTFSTNNPRILYQDGGASLRRDAATWGMEVDSIVASGKVPSSPVQMLTQTPLVMQMLGAKERPVYAAPHLFDGTHPNITPDMLKGLPQALADPIAIFQSKTHKDRLVFMLEMTDASGATVVVPVHLDGTKYRTTIHIATTVYAKNNKRLPDNEWFVKQAGNALYINRQKEKRWLMVSGSNSLWDAANASSGKNIRTEADLVNLRQQNPDMYAGGKNSPRGNILFRPQDHAAMISIFKGKGDISTIVHEGAGHLFLENLREAAQQQSAPDWVRSSWETIAFDIGANADPAQDVAVESHEKFARMTVEYFRRGKAPSQELRGVFRMFGRWLASLYRGVRRIMDLEEISPEVERAMARLIATEDDMVMAERILKPQETAPDGADVNKWAEYLKLTRDAQKDAEAAIALRRMEEEQRVTKEARLEAKILMTSDQNMLDISRLKSLGGISIQDITETFGEETAWTVRERWSGFGKRLVKKDGKLNIDDILQELGMTEPQQALAWLLDAQTEREFTDSVIAERLAEWEASYSPQAEAVASTSADAALKARDEALSGENQVNTRDLLGSFDRRASDMTFDGIDAEYGALKAAEDRRAAAKTLSAEVIGAERKRRAAMGTAYRVRMEREKIKGQIRRTANFKTALDPFHQQILAIVARYDGLGTKAMRPRQGIPAIQDFFKQWTLYNGMDESQAPAIPEWLTEHMGLQADMRLGDLTIEQFRELHMLIKQLHHMGRTAGALVGALHKADIQNTVNSLTQTMDRLPETAHIDEISRQTMFGKVRILLRNSYASKAIMRYVFKMADGYVSHGDSLEMGNNERLIHRPLADAANVELKLRKEYSKLLRDALAPLAKMENLTQPFKIDGVSLPDGVTKEWRGMWTMEKVFSLSLNMGNEGNIKAIMGGYGFSQEDLSIITSRMTPELWESVRKVWAALETMYPRLNAVHEALYGVPLTKVEHTPFQVQLGGQVMEMPGGYYPLIFDRRFSKKAAKNEDFDEALNAHEAIMRNPNPKSGFVEGRKGARLPPLLSIDVLSRHITDAIHYAAFTLPLRDAYVLTSDARYEASFTRAFGEELHKELLPWLRAIARPEPKLKSTGDKIINWMAARGTLTTLGFSPRTATMGFTSIPNSLHRVGFVPFVKSAAYFAVHPFKTWRMMTELSSYMDNRASIMDRDMRSYLDTMFNRADFINMGPIKISRKKFEKAAFAMIVAVDSVVAAPTWLAQHERALEDGMDMEAAIRAADDAVFEAQAGGSVVDMSAMMRDPGMMRLLTVFMTFTSNQYNKTSYYWRGLKDRLKNGEAASDIGLGDFSKYMALEIVGSSALIALIFALAQEGEAPEAKDVGWEILGTLLGGNPLLRMVPSMMRYGTKAGQTAGMKGVQSVGDAAHIGIGMLDGEFTTKERRKKFIRSCVNAAGFLVGVPTVPMWRVVDGIEAFEKGKGGPLTPIFGPPPKKKKKGGLL